MKLNAIKKIFNNAKEIVEENRLVSNIVKSDDLVRIEIDFSLGIDDKPSCYVVAVREHEGKLIPGVVFINKEGPEFDPYSGVHLQNRRYAYEVAQKVEQFLFEQAKKENIELYGV